MTATYPLPLTGQATALAAPISGTEGAAFWVIAAVVVIGALGVVFSRKAVHSAVMMALVMLSLAVFYGMNEAPFLMVVQIVVYTGAVLMLFLFVLMLIGVSATDSLVETIRGQRVLTMIVALCFLGALSLGLTRIVTGDPAGLGAGVAAAGGNIPWIAGEVIYRYIIAFEATGALLITAVLGALVLAHNARTKKRRTQKELAKERIRGNHPTPLPGPGTYARHNAIDMPALLPDGSVAELSLNPVLTARDPALQSDVPKDIRTSMGPAPGSDLAPAQAEEVRAQGGHRPAGNGQGSQDGQDGQDGPDSQDGTGGDNGETGQEAERSWTR